MRGPRRRFEGTVPWLVVAVCLVAASLASGRPMNGEVVTIREPDGTHVDVRVWGDEFYARGETLDGYAVVRDRETGMLSYARLSDDGRTLLSTGVPAGDAPPAGLEKHLRIDAEAASTEARLSREAFELRAIEGPYAPEQRAGRGPTTGEVQGITLIVDFDDDVGTIPSSWIDDYCNLVGYTGYGNHGSVRDYFHDVSDERLDYTNFVPTHYFRASRDKSYYTDPDAPYGQRARELIIEALTALDESGFDFSEYDADGNGTVDALNCFYAGGIWNSWAEGLWPHASGVSFCADGVCTSAYQITNLGSTLALGTFCHENGHMLMGWPDLYDYDGDSAGVGVYCLMAGGGFGTNPVEPCAYMKDKAGWADVTSPTEPVTGLVVPADQNVVYKFDHPTQSNEYFLIENRQRTARDLNLTDDGLAIWHIDTNGNNSNQQQTPDLHYLVTLVQADGRWDLEHNQNSGDGNDLYAAPSYTDCSPHTYPNTNWWDGSVSGLSFMNVSTSGMSMTFDFIDLPPPRPADLTAEAQELSVSLKWGPASVADLDYYSVDRDTTAAFGSGTESMATVDTTYVDGPLVAGTEYFYRVTAIDLAGHVSDPSDTVSAVPLADVAPSIPISLEAIGGGGVVELRWAANPEVDVAGYRIVRDSTLAFAYPETLGMASGVSFVDTTSSPVRASWYLIMAEDEAGNASAPTNPVTGIAAPGQTFYVDASNSGAQNGSYTNPYRAIHSAMFRVDPGDVIIVYPGDYPADVELTDEVPVIGMRGADVTVISGYMSGIGIGGDTVLKGFTFDGGGVVTTELDLFNCDLVVEDCAFANATGAGVNSHHGGAPTIRRNSFTGNSTGVTCADASSPLLTSNVFEGNSFANIFVSGSPGPLVGGSLAAANDFLDHGAFMILNTGGGTIAAEYNYWGDDCVEATWFSGAVDYTPWTDASHVLEFVECGTGVPDGEIPFAAYAGPSFPNPTRHGTNIAFGLPSPGGAVSLRIYNASGRLVRTLVDETLPPGRHVASWDGRDESGAAVSSGVYFYRLTSPGIEQQGKTVVLK